MRQQAATGLPPASRIASRHSRDETPVEIISSTISTGWFLCEMELRRSVKFAVLSLDIHGGHANWRPIS